MDTTAGQREAEPPNIGRTSLVAIGQLVESLAVRNRRHLTARSRGQQRTDQAVLTP